MVATGATTSDTDLVAGVRAGDDAAFEELYRRYQRRIASFVRRVVRDEARAEDVTQEAFMSALRRMRATDTEISFKPWIYEIARNAAIDSWRRSSRAEEVSINQDELLRPGDRSRLVGGGGPDKLLLDKERMDHLCRAMDELSQTHHRIIVMRELEGLSYREIGERLELSRPAVESTLFRARRRLEREYEEIEAGRRCDAMEQAIARISEGVQSKTDERRLSRHARGCSNCRRRARQLGVEPLRSRRVAARAAAFLPLPGFLRRRFSATQTAPPPGPDAGALTALVAPGAHVGAAVAERAAALVAAVAIAGAGTVVLGGPATQHRAGTAPDHHRSATAGARHNDCAGAPAAGPRARGRIRAGSPAGLAAAALQVRRCATGREVARPDAPGQGRRRAQAVGPRHDRGAGSSRRPLRPARADRSARQAGASGRAGERGAPATGGAGRCPGRGRPAGPGRALAPRAAPLICRRMAGGSKSQRTEADSDSFLESLMETSLYSMGAYFSDQHPDLVDEVIAQSDAIERAGLRAYADDHSLTVEECFETLLTGLAVRYYNAVAA